MYLKAGEDLDVLVDGFNGTGYMWMNNLDYADRKGLDVDGHIAFLKDEKYLDDQLFNDDSDGKQMMGGQSSSKISFSTTEGHDFNEAIRFAYQRPWMMKGDFPAKRQDFIG